jgi:hypothetical protein
MQPAAFAARQCGFDDQLGDGDEVAQLDQMR